MTAADTTTGAAFPSWARLGLGIIVGIVSYLVVGNLQMSEETRGLVTMLILLLSSAGIVPPTVESLPALSPAVRFGLVLVVVVLGYLLTVTIDMSTTLREILIAVLAFLSSVGITPPQAGARNA